MELGEKIRLEAVDIMNGMGLNVLTLQLIRKVLNISPFSLEHCKSGDFNQQNCYPQMLNGLKTTYSLLSDPQVYKEFDLTNFLLDLQEFTSNIEEQMKAQSIPIPPHSSQKFPRDIPAFQEKAGVFLVLHDLSIALSTFQQGLDSQ